MMSSLISNITPCTPNQTWISSVNQLTRATYITGSVYADEPGICYIDQSGDGTNWDITTEYEIQGFTGTGAGVKIETDVIDQFFRVRYVNGAQAQTVFRLFVDIRDPYGDFLVAQSGPSAGGNWFVLYFNPNSQVYEVVGRFNATDGWNANGNAAISSNRSGQYASVPVSNFVVTTETLIASTEHAVASF